MSYFTTLNPRTEEPIATYDWMSEKTIELRLTHATKAQKAWAKTKIKHRTALLLKLEKNIVIHRHDFAKLMANEMGKPLKQGLAEIDKCARLCAYYAEQAESFLAPQTINTEHQLAQRTFFPIGLILGIMPWNFPFWQVFRFAIPNLMLGNGCILKHAPNTTACGLSIENIIKESGFPEGVFNTLLIDVPNINNLIAHSAIAGVTITGSSRAGKAVAAAAGQALKKVVLELGGSDPYLILADANLEHAAQCCVQSRLNNSGQVCIAAKRILVDQAIASPFIEQVLAQARHYHGGDPLDITTTMGPLARQDLLLSLEEQVNRVMNEGARCLLGGQRQAGKGYFYPATVLIDVPINSFIINEELFGPIICITTVQSEQQAIELANQSCYGLSAAVFTQDEQRGQRIAEQLEVGACAINNFVASDPRLPFGGIKQSGFGRELAIEGLHEFANTKIIITN